METKSDSKRKKDKHDDSEDNRREKKSRRHRSRSRSREEREKDSRRKRRHSRSKSPNVPVKQEKRREEAPNGAPAKKDAPERKAKDTDMLNTRTGGAYIPPARLRMMQAQITDKSSMAYQRLAWEALKKSIHGHINKINVGNIGIIIKELLKENIVRGRGLLCRSVIQAQAASPTFTNVYAALVAAVNSRFPNIGELLLKRLVIQFKRGFKRNDKPICISSASFIAHLVNQRVAHEILALELLTLLVETPTDDSVEVAIAFLKECGQKLTEVSSKGVNAIFEMLRNILHEGQLDKRVQYMIEVMFQVWKDGFKDHPALIEELELVPEEEQFTHLLMLDDATDPQDILNVFKLDEKYEENEQKYKTLSKEILGSDVESGEEDGSEESGSEGSDDEDEQEGEQKGMTIIDNTETNLVALRRTIYLTINSSLDFEECAHKLMKMQLKPGQEVELCHMFLDCCAEQRTYEKFYGLLAQRFCNINRIYIGPFEEIFKDSYGTAHRLDTNRLRNVSKFFAHLLFTDSISWEVMECVKLNEEDTTSSSRIYIKILFQELAEYMGLKKLNDRLKDPTLQEAFAGIFPRDNPKNTRFSINFFTSIGLGGLTDELREHLKQMPKNVPAQITDINVESESSSDSSSSSSSSDSSSDSSSSDSEQENTERKKKNKKSKEKEKPQANDDVPDKNDKTERWGHDGFYDTYGENAQRYENRSERSEQNRNNFARPRDVSRRYDDRERQRNNERGNKDERRNDRGSRDGEECRGRRMENDRAQERHRHSDNRRNSSDDVTNERNTKDNRNDRRPEKVRSDRNEIGRCDDNTPWRDKDKEQRDRDNNAISDRARDDDRENRDKGRSNRTEEVERKPEKENRDRGRYHNDKSREDNRNLDKERRDQGREHNDKNRGDDRSSEREKRDQGRDNERNRGDFRNSERENRDQGRDYNARNRGDDRNSERENRDQGRDYNAKNRRDDNNSERDKKDKGRDYNERNRGDDRNAEKEKRDKCRDYNDRTREDNRSSENEKRDQGRDKKISTREDDRNSERENRDKRRDNNDKSREDDRYSGRGNRNQRNGDINDRENDRSRDRNKEDTSYRKIKDKDIREDRVGREVGNREDSERIKNGNKNEDDSRHRQKEDRNKAEPEKRKQRQDKIEKNKHDSTLKTKTKNKSKEDKRKKRDSGSSSSEDSEEDSTSSSSSSDSNSDYKETGGRYWDSFDIEKPAHRKRDKTVTPEIKEKRNDRRRER